MRCCHSDGNPSTRRYISGQRVARAGDAEGCPATQVASLGGIANGGIPTHHGRVVGPLIVDARYRNPEFVFEAELERGLWCRHPCLGCGEPDVRWVEEQATTQDQ